MYGERWLTFNSFPVQLTAVHVVATADLVTPSTLSNFGSFTPASSLTFPFLLVPSFVGLVSVVSTHLVSPETIFMATWISIALHDQNSSHSEPSLVASSFRSLRPAIIEPIQRDYLTRNVFSFEQGFYRVWAQAWVSLTAGLQRSPLLAIPKSKKDAARGEFKSTEKKQFFPPSQFQKTSKIFVAELISEQETFCLKVPLFYEAAAFRAWLLDVSSELIQSNYNAVSHYCVCSASILHSLADPTSRSKNTFSCLFHQILALHLVLNRRICPPLKRLHCSMILSVTGIVVALRLLSRSFIIYFASLKTIIRFAFQRPFCIAFIILFFSWRLFILVFFWLKSLSAHAD